MWQMRLLRGLIKSDESFGGASKLWMEGIGEGKSLVLIAVLSIFMGEKFNHLAYFDGSCLKMGWR
jgi:hypothetical protein